MKQFFIQEENEAEAMEEYVLLCDQESEKDYICKAIDSESENVYELRNNAAIKIDVEGHSESENQEEEETEDGGSRCQSADVGAVDGGNDEQNNISLLDEDDAESSPQMKSGTLTAHDARFEEQEDSAQEEREGTMEGEHGSAVLGATENTEVLRNGMSAKKDLIQEPHVSPRAEQLIDLTEDVKNEVDNIATLEKAKIPKNEPEVLKEELLKSEHVTELLNAQNVSHLEEFAKNMAENVLREGFMPSLDKKTEDESKSTAAINEICEPEVDKKAEGEQKPAAVQEEHVASSPKKETPKVAPTSRTVTKTPATTSVANKTKQEPTKRNAPRTLPPKPQQTVPRARTAPTTDKPATRTPTKTTQSTTSTAQRSNQPSSPMLPPTPKTSKKYANVRSKVNSITDYKPSGGNVKIFSQKKTFDVPAKVGSLTNANHTPVGGHVVIETYKTDFRERAKPRIDNKNEHKRSQSAKKIPTQKLEWKAESKIGSLENASHKPAGGNIKILSTKLEWKAESKVGSKDNINHRPAGGDVKIFDEKLKLNGVKSKIGSLENASHVPGGGNVKIEDYKVDVSKAGRIRETRSSASNESGRRSSSLSRQRLNYGNKMPGARDPLTAEQALGIA